MKNSIQKFGKFLSAMVMPNIGAFIAWGFITALFIEAGWIPNERLATLVDPMLKYLIPTLIAFQGGRMVGGDRGGVMGAVATLGVIAGSEQTMLIGAMAMGPFAGLVIKKFDKAVEGKIPAGFEMLVNNFSVGIFGMILAIIINRKETRAKGFWRFCFVLSIAVPQFVSLLIMRSMLQPTGIVNTLLMKYGIIDTALPFFTKAMWARVTVIVINLWVGIPYTILQVTGILQNIPAELYEAAKIDGANAVQTFFKITLPYMLFVMTPYLITQFTGNINNFNVIYLLSGGNPTPVDATAGKTDLLVTWLYKLTVDKKYFNLGAVIGIMTFVVLAIVALVTYRNTTSYKDEEGFM